VRLRWLRRTKIGFSPKNDELYDCSAVLIIVELSKRFEIDDISLRRCRTMIIFQRMQIWGATLLLTAGVLLAACGTEPQSVQSDENIVVVYNCNTDDWTAPLAKEFQEQTWDLAYKSFVCYALVLNYPLLRQCCVLLVQRITNSFYSRS